MDPKNFFLLVLIYMERKYIPNKLSGIPYNSIEIMPMAIVLYPVVTFLVFSGVLKWLHMTD